MQEASGQVGDAESSAASLSAVPQDGFFRLEGVGAVAAEVDRCLRKVEQVREDVRREVAGAEVQLELSGQHLLMRRPALGERLHRCLDAPQTPDVG